MKKQRKMELVGGAEGQGHDEHLPLFRPVRCCYNVTEDVALRLLFELHRRFKSIANVGR
jgi:hypothetical protein